MAFWVLSFEQVLGRAAVELDESKEFAAAIKEAVKWNETAEMGAFVNGVACFGSCRVIKTTALNH